MRSILFLILLATCLLVAPATADDPAVSELDALRDQVKQLDRMVRELAAQLTSVEKRLSELEAASRRPTPNAKPAPNAEPAPTTQPAPRVKTVPRIFEELGDYLRFPVEVERAMMMNSRARY